MVVIQKIVWHKYQTKTLRNRKKIVVYIPTHDRKYLKQIVTIFLPLENKQIFIINTYFKVMFVFTSNYSNIYNCYCFISHKRKEMMTPMHVPINIDPLHGLYIIDLWERFNLNLDIFNRNKFLLEIHLKSILVIC